MKLPWLKFYPSDWLSDEALRCCPLDARGLWIDLIAIMAKSESHGYLLIGGKPATSEQLARISGVSTERVEELLGQLESAGVFSKDNNGSIYSRKMVREEGGRKSARERLLRFRNANETQVKRLRNANETGQSPESRVQRLESERKRPSRADWLSYAKEIIWDAKDADSAFDYYESNGWRVGGKAPVKDWQACARNCQRRSQQNKPKGNQQPMKRIVSQCESLPTWKVMKFKSREAWVEAGCP
jgi:hypothetical protein